MLFVARIVYLSVFLFGLIVQPAQAQTQPQGSVDSGDYQIHYSVFPSTFLQPDIAAAYHLKRSKYEALLNISVTRKGEYGGLTAQVTGQVVNLMQQQKPLLFVQIEEKETAYYIAPIRITGEEIVHFIVNAKVAGVDTALQVKFSSKLVAQ